MRNPYYERLLVYIGHAFYPDLLVECPKMKKEKGSPAVFEVWTTKNWDYAIYIYEELETEDSPKFDVIPGMKVSNNEVEGVKSWLQSVIDNHMYVRQEKKEDDKGTGTENG